MPPEQTKRATSSTDSAGIRLPPTKKTRFLDPADDETNFANEVDAALENPSATRKGRVKTDGYESDSSDDGEGVVLSRRSGVDGAANDEDEDMFAAEPKEKDTKIEAGEKKKSEEFLRLGDIEGQEFGRGSADDDADDSSGDDEEPEDEDDAERRNKAGMGYEISSFNMREEMEEGKFSADGMYVRNFDPHVLHDRWMDGLGEREIKLARKRKRRQEKAQMEKMRAEEEELELLGGKDAVEREVLAMLKKGETVLEALQRLGTTRNKQQSKEKHSRCATAAAPFPLLSAALNVNPIKRCSLADDESFIPRFRRGHGQASQLGIRRRAPHTSRFDPSLPRRY